MLAMTYSSLASTIGAKWLNFRVRNEIGWTPLAESPTLKADLWQCELRVCLQFVYR